MPRKAVDDGSSAWTPAILVGDMEGIPGCWFGPGPAPVIAVFGE